MTHNTQRLADAPEPRLKRIAITICEPCLNGIGSECHTPGCAMYLHRVDLPIAKELYEELAALDAQPQAVSRPMTPEEVREYRESTGDYTTCQPMTTAKPQSGCEDVAKACIAQERGSRVHCDCPLCSSFKGLNQALNESIDENAQLKAEVERLKTDNPPCFLHPEHGPMKFVGRGISDDFGGSEVNLFDCQKCTASKRVQVSERSYESGWISVEERLPEEGETVLVWTGTYPETAAIMRDKDGPFWSGAGFFSVSIGTHWRPLPPAPETQEEKR